MSFADVTFPGNSAADMRICKDYYNGMIPRPEPIHQIKSSFKVHPVTSLLGPRQEFQRTENRTTDPQSFGGQRTENEPQKTEDRPASQLIILGSAIMIV